MFKFKKQTYSEDMFADTRMSFGDHLEDLRIHLWRALYWFFFMIIGVFILDGIGLITKWKIPYTNVQIGVGYPVFRFMISPIQQELSEYRIRRAKKILETLENDPTLRDANRSRIVWMSFIREQLTLALQGKNPNDLPPLPDEGKAVEFSQLVGRAQLQAAAATGALTAHRWVDMKSISQGLQAAVNRLPEATKVPEDLQENFASWSEDLSQKAAELSKQVDREDADKAEKALQQIQTLLSSREMVSLPMRIDEPVRFFAMISQAEAEVNQTNDPVSLSPMESFMGYFKVALLCGLVLGSPWIFFHLWTFIAAGLYPHEKRLVNVYLPFSVSLFVVGALACQFLVIPRALGALLWFNEWLEMQPQFRFNEWLSFAILMPLVFGLSFQLPLVMMFLERVGIMTVQGYLSYWKVAFLIIHILAAFLMPTPDIFSMEMLAIPLLGLYGLGILLCRFNPHDTEREEETSESEQMVEV
jgi:sec-independent protein translocase protein TatC